MTDTSQTPEAGEPLRQFHLEELFRSIKDRCRRVKTLATLECSRPMFFNMDCRIVARELREIADEIEGLVEE